MTTFSLFFFRFLHICLTFLGDFNPQQLPSRRLLLALLALLVLPLLLALLVLPLRLRLLRLQQLQLLRRLLQQLQLLQRTPQDY